jgi:N-acetylglucosamine-6-phosphate deacetylase
MKQVFFGARLFDGQRFIDDHALVTEGASIVGIVPVADRPRGIIHHDLGGGILSPGFIDAQINGGGGVLLNETPSVKGIDGILAAHRAFGTTHALPTLITDSPEILAETLSAGKTAANFVPGYLGLHIEGPFIDPKRAGAHPIQHIRDMKAADAALLIKGKAGVLMLTLAPNYVSSERISQLTEAGIIVSLGHSDASDHQAYAAIDAGASAVTHLYNAMSPLHHRSPGLTGAAMADPRIITGLIADGHHVSPTAIYVALAAKGPDGIALVSDAMPPAAGGPESFELQGRTASRMGTKLTLPDGTLAGSAITMLEAIRYLVLELRVDIDIALRMATRTPARMLQIDGKYGSFTTGASASVVHLTDDLRVRGVWIDGLAQWKSENVY